MKHALVSIMSTGKKMMARRFRLNSLPQSFCRLLTALLLAPLAAAPADAT